MILKYFSIAKNFLNKKLNKMWNRIKIIAIAALTVLLYACNDSEEKLMRKADKIHFSILSVDTHADTPLDFSRSGFDMGVWNDFGCVDFPRMKAGGLDAIFFSYWTAEGPRNDTANVSLAPWIHNKYADAYNYVYSLIKQTNEIVDKYSSMAEIALTADDAYRIKREGKSAVFIGIENGYPVGIDITRVKDLYDLGARYITLSHGRNNDICDSSTDPLGAEHDGLSDFGKQVIKEMNRLGMIIDVAHISDKSFYDVLAHSKAPIIASHASARALCNNSRNHSDEMLLAIKENGGVTQICTLTSYLIDNVEDPEMVRELATLRDKYGDPDSMSDEDRNKFREESRNIRQKYARQATVIDVVNHIDHVVKVAGIDHVGIGTDFGGSSAQGVRDASEMKNITIELLRRGYTKKEIEKILGGNTMRVLRQVEQLAEKY
jgi:membrane dipeptidase